MTNFEENQSLSENPPLGVPNFNFARAADEYNAIADKIEAEFGAECECRGRRAFADRQDAELSLARIRSRYRAMCKGWRDQERRDRGTP